MILPLILSLTLTLTTLLFWTITPSVFATPKEFVLTSATIILLLLTGYQAFKTKTLTLPPLKASLPLLLFALTILGSLLANPEGRPEALAGRGLSLLALSTLALLSLTTSVWTKYLTPTLHLLATALSLHSLLSLSFLSRSAYVPLYMQTQSFTPTGSYITTLIFILVSLAVAALELKKSPHKPLLLASLTLNTIATVAIVSLMLPGGPLSPATLPLLPSWSIALDALKSFRSLLFGIGLSNYSLLYTSVKPLSLNATSLWNTLPTSGGSEVFTLLPTAGVLATVALLYLIFRALIQNARTVYFYATIVLALAFFLTPFSLPLYVLFFLLYVARPQSLVTRPLSRPASLTLGGVFLALAILYLLPISRSIASEYLIKQSQRALDRGDSQKVYETHQLALRYSPNITNYHLSFADLNFKLASALSQKSEITDSEREIIANLVQQSISASKNAITLRPNDARTWLSLAKTYQNLINVAEGSENFALEAYARAISLDRANPALRLEYAGLLASLADKETNSTQSATLRQRAASEIGLALQLKNDYANAYYNLATLANRAGDRKAALTALENTLKYLSPDSTDYGRVQSELETLRAKDTPPLPAPPTDDSILTTPSPLPEPLEGGPLELAE